MCSAAAKTVLRRAENICSSITQKVRYYIDKHITYVPMNNIREFIFCRDYSILFRCEGNEQLLLLTIFHSITYSFSKNTV